MARWSILLVAGCLLATPGFLRAEKPAQLKVQRVVRRAESEVRRDLAAIPEIGLGAIGQPRKLPGEKKARAPEFALTMEYLQKRDDLRGLPVRMGDDCRMDENRIHAFRATARELRRFFGVMYEASPGDDEMVAELLRRNLSERRLLPVPGADAVPVLMQMLTPEEEAVRLVLVDFLKQVPDKCASQALAQLAVFDLSTEVRRAALAALAARPRAEVRAYFVAALEHPLPAAPQHAAEALVALRDRAALADVEKLLRAPDPRRPFLDPKENKWLVREVVRVNHLTNCMLCHAPESAVVDPNKPELRGVVPVPGETLPPPTRYYSSGDVFVRADQVYLRQDFSLKLPVKDHGIWPEMQRFDFVVRTRAATPADRERILDDAAYRQAIQFAVSGLRGKSSRTVAASSD
ncbi:MAG: hypothetical protein AB7K24_15315 [Gemmataceae bacterium]